MLVIGSRGSKLARWQAEWVKARLGALGAECRIEIIRTTGDKITDVPLAKVGSKGLFTKEIEEALLAGSVDLAVHSLKDLPTELPAGLKIAAIPEREDPRDALLGRKLADLRDGDIVGTSSLRRAAQLRALRPGLRIDDLRGNVDTRLRKLDEGRYQAILLACAGLRRLGWGERIAQALEPEAMCPAVGQGALAIETRDDAGDAAKLCGRMMDTATQRAVIAERAVLATLGGGCQVPLGAHAVVRGEELRMQAVVISPDGSEVYRDSIAGAAAAAETLGGTLGERLLAAGAHRILEAVYGGKAQRE